MSAVPENLPATLPDISTARLPANYEAAKVAISECSRIDECQSWADKSEAMASYAKQAKDESLRKMADRIQARAIRRCGELLKQIPSGTGSHLKREGDRPYSGLDLKFASASQHLTRSVAAENAGLSEHQRKTALRVASVPEESFNSQVESESPPTVTQLAEQGKKRLVDLGDSRPADFALATQALAHLKRFAEFAKETDAARVASGIRPSEVAAARAHVRAIDSWLDQFITRVGD